MLGRKSKILIAEDDQTQLMILKQDFEAAGYEVYTFDDGADVLPMVDEIMPSLVVLDIQLPHADGWEIARKLNSNPNTRHIPVVIVSGIDLEEAKGHVLMHGCIDFLQKPVETDEIMSRMDKYIKLGEIRLRASRLMDKA